LGGLGINGRIILKWILRKQGMKVCSGFSLIRDTEAGTCEHETKPSGSTKDGEFLDQLNYYYLLNENSALYGVSYQSTITPSLHVRLYNFSKTLTL
jgi:hypothetical protein